MRAGDLDRPIQIIRDVDAGFDDYGMPITSPSVIASPMADVKGMGGREFLEAGTPLAEDRVTFRIRWRAGLLVTDRIVWEGRSYDIASMREIGRRQGLEIMARRVT